MNAKAIKSLQDIRHPDALPDRRFQPKPAMLYLMQLRSFISHAIPSRRRMDISIQFKGGNEIHAKPVKITHL